MSSENGTTQAVQRRVIIAGALLAASGVALGAFGAHGLRATLAPAALGWWQTAVDYQMWHAIALIAIGAIVHARAGVPATLIAAGTIIFSGTLYMMALGAPRWLGMITPFGGMLMILGWLALAWKIWRRPNVSRSPARATPE